MLLDGQNPRRGIQVNCNLYHGRRGVLNRCYTIVSVLCTPAEICNPVEALGVCLVTEILCKLFVVVFPRRRRAVYPNLLVMVW